MCFWLGKIDDSLNLLVNVLCLEDDYQFNLLVNAHARVDFPLAKLSLASSSFQSMHMSLCPNF
jgi:hypothetical protein